MSRSIIIEGADGHGKSTLTCRLATDLNYELITCGPHPSTPMKYLGYLHGQRMALKRGNTILDRHTPMSTYAYSNINEQPVTENAAVQHARITAMNVNPIFIFCCVSEPTVDENKSYKTDSYITTVKDKNAYLVSRYVALFGLMQITPIVYDWQNESYRKLLRGIKYAADTN